MRQPSRPLVASRKGSLLGCHHFLGLQNTLPSPGSVRDIFLELFHRFPYHTQGHQAQLQDTVLQAQLQDTGTTSGHSANFRKLSTLGTASGHSVLQAQLQDTQHSAPLGTALAWHTQYFKQITNSLLASHSQRNDHLCSAGQLYGQWSHY